MIISHITLLSLSVDTKIPACFCQSIRVNFKLSKNLTGCGAGVFNKINKLLSIVHTLEMFYKHFMRDQIYIITL